VRDLVKFGFGFAALRYKLWRLRCCCSIGNVWQQACSNSRGTTMGRKLVTKRKSEAGQVLILAVLSLVVLMGLLGLGIDVGYLRHMRTKMQQAADAAALAGASEVNYGDMTAAADNDAASNGFTNGSNSTTITVNNPPVYGGYTGNSSAVEVIIQQAQPTFFMSVLGFTQVNVAARAVAYLGSAPGCIYALSPSATGITLNGTVTAACAVDVDSSSGSALDVTSGTLSAKSVGVVGGYSGEVTPTPITGIPPASDPFASLSPPSVGSSCTYSNQVTIRTRRGRNYQVYPCVYGGGLVITGRGDVTFNAGTYNFTAQPGLEIDGAVSGSTQGNGVTIYATGNAGITINITGGIGFTLTAPTSGAYSGILMFQNPSDTTAASISGVNSTALTGALYFPTAQVTMNGGNCGAAYSILVAYTAVFNGTNCFNDNYPSSGSPIKTAVLAE
jgi:Flp pilus assembly protein TadG